MPSPHDDGVLNWITWQVPAWRPAVPAGSRNDLAAFEDDSRRAVDADRLAQLELLADRVGALGGLDLFTFDHLVHRPAAVTGAPHRLQLLITRRAEPLAREGDIAHFDTATVQLGHFGVQFVAIRQVVSVNTVMCDLVSPLAG